MNKIIGLFVALLFSSINATMAPESAAVEANTAENADFSRIKDTIYFYGHDNTLCSIKFDYVDGSSDKMPEKFSAQYFEQLCSSNPKIFVKTIRIHNTYFLESKSFTIRLTSALVKFLRENASYYGSKGGRYQLAALFYWLSKKEFAIYDNEGEAVKNYEERLRTAAKWLAILDQINTIRLSEDPEVPEVPANTSPK